MCLYVIIIKLLMNDVSSHANNAHVPPHVMFSTKSLSHAFISFCHYHYDYADADANEGNKSQ